MTSTLRNVLRDLVPYGVAVRVAASRERRRRAAVAARAAEMRRAVEPARGETRLARINVGCGTHREPGWWNLDIAAGADLQHRIEIGSPLPFPSASLDVVFSEHFIEHIPLETARWLMSEANRVLRPRGLWRSSTPDLEWVLASGSGEWRALAKVYEDIGDFPPGVLTRGSEVVNWAFHGHGHQYLWSLADFDAHLSAAGFGDIRRVGYGESRIPGAAIETRTEEAFYSLIVEATRR